MMNWNEHEEMIAEMNARQDYLSEAYGSEAKMLEDQARDEEEYYHNQWWNGLTPEEQDKELSNQASREARLEAERVAAENDDCPF